MAQSSKRQKTGDMTDVSSLKVAVIGAGPSGTAVLRAFSSARDKGDAIPQITCFEKQADVGGLWNYSWRTGLDQHGEPVHNSMYRYLWSNGPKECLEFADYTFEEHFGKVIPSFPPREVLFDYIKGRLNKANVRDWIRFKTAVRDVTFDETTEKFTLKARNLESQSETTETYDYVLVCSGHFSTPNVPEFPGFEKFEGRILHAHDFRDAVEFKGKDICVIGTSYSAEDIASQCYKYGCKSVICSYRTAPMGFHWPDNFKTLPLLTKVEGDTGYFRADPERGFPTESTAKLDAIILCTGYQHHFPFLSDTLRLRTANRLWVGPEDAKGDGDGSLYHGIMWDKNPKLMYIGMQDQWFTFNMFDAQAWWARDVIMGRIKPPSKEEMAAEFQKMRANEEKLVTDADNYEFQGNYIRGLIGETDYPTFDIDAVHREFDNWENNKHHGIMTFRDKVHKSVMTKNESTIHHTPWLEALDDSMKCYLAATREESEAQSTKKVAC
jgi:trimethylamine monooxygenase